MLHVIRGSPEKPGRERVPCQRSSVSVDHSCFNATLLPLVQPGDLIECGAVLVQPGVFAVNARLKIHEGSNMLCARGVSERVRSKRQHAVFIMGR